MEMFLHTTFLVTMLLAQTCIAQQYTCDDAQNNFPVCECKTNVCYFKLVIEHMQTFTAYETKAPRGTRGRVHNIRNGEFYPVRREGTNLPCEDLINCTDIHSVDGSTFRSLLAINKQFPGPTLIVNEGSTVVVDVFNFLTTEETSIHWHGIHQRNIPWMDGVGYISQCPIGAGGSFRYIFKAEPTGTLWYHSHSGPQRTDGLFGALIVREKQTQSGFVDSPESHTLTLLDWQREASLDLFVQIHSSIGFFEGNNVDEIPVSGREYTQTCSADGAEVGPIPYWSGIINGKGRHKDISFSRIRLSSFDVERGEKYRFRLIGAQGTYAYMFSIDNHKLTLIATDGFFIEPVEVDYIIIHTGERYDFLLLANQAGKTNFLIRAETLEVDCGTLKRTRKLQNNDAIAVLTYDKSPISRAMVENEYKNGRKKCSASSVCRVANCPFENYPPGSGYNCSDLHVHELQLSVPTDANELPKSNAVASTNFFNFGFDSDEFTSTINGRNFILPSTSLQTQGYRQIESEICEYKNDNIPCKTGECTCVRIVNIKKNLHKKTIRFVLSSLSVNIGSSFAHPIHLHGHSFFVVKVGYGKYNARGKLTEPTEDISCDSQPCSQAPEWRNGTPDISITTQTIRKDTLIVPAGGYVVIDFIADNPGYWFLHCHIESHQLEGMALVINELESQQNPPPEGMLTCGNFYWTVEEFNKKINLESYGKGGLSVCCILIIILGVLLGVCFPGNIVCIIIVVKKCKGKC